MMELVSDPDAEESLASPVRNHGKIDPRKLQPHTRQAIIWLQQALATEPGILRAQVTFDDIHGDQAGHDDPPSIHVITDPSLAPDWPSYWFGPSSMGRPE